jgi:SNF2 family DNA or RNA helicase
MVPYATLDDWLVGGEPRLVQLEALSRSWFGSTAYTPRGRLPEPLLLGSEPRIAPGWGHFIDMRLGKTLVALAEMRLARRDMGLSRFLVLSPNKFVADWAMEGERAGVPVTVFNTKMVRAGKLDRIKQGVVVINYEALVQRPVAQALTEWIAGGMVVADESITIKNPSSDTARAVLLLSKQVVLTRALSGKPITRSAGDLWAQLRFIRALGGQPYTAFRAQFCQMGGWMGKKIIGTRPETLPLLHRILDSCSFTASKLDWMGIGPPDYLIREVQLTPEQRAAYRRMLHEFYVVVDNGVATGPQIVTQLLRLQQITQGYVRTETGQVSWLVAPGQNPKLRELRALLDDEIPDNVKVLVVCVSNPIIDMLCEELREYGVATIRGGVDAVAAKERFNEDPTCRVMVAQSKAVKYGHRLMGSTTHPCLYTVFYENNYNLDDRAQAEERNRGAGQVATTTVIDLVASPIERAIAKALQKKEDVAAAVLRTPRVERS